MREALKQLGAYIAAELGFRAYSVFGHLFTNEDGTMLLNDWHPEMRESGFDDMRGQQFYIRHTGPLRYSEQSGERRGSCSTRPKPFIMTVPLRIVAWSAGGPKFFDPYQLEPMLSALLVNWGGPAILPAGVKYQYSKPSSSNLDILEVLKSEGVKYEGGDHVTGVMVDFDINMWTDCYLIPEEKSCLYLPDTSC